MCGIAGIILKQGGALPLGEAIVRMTRALAHRGPDGEGYLLGDSAQVTPYAGESVTGSGLPYLPVQPVTEAPADAMLAFGHRRLNIIDLSIAGHQPMCNADGSLWINFNGEIYNYVELRDELTQAGYPFYSSCDTEVVLAAYHKWGDACVERFNGMWAFCVLDLGRRRCFASRDRLGVKPFYYMNQERWFAFASEQKAFVRGGLQLPVAREEAVADYIVNAALERSEENFFDGILELMPGHNLYYGLDDNTVTLKKFYDLTESVSLSNDALRNTELVQRIRATFDHAVKLRLRSDVEVGTCLSGGIDSSAIAVTVDALRKQPLNCFTSVFPGEPFNEERFASLVAQHINGRLFKVQPTLKGFLKEVDTLVYSQDVPIWDTSTYAQFKVMELSARHHVKVVLDGQGADELFAGYHHHYIARWNGMLGAGRIGAAVADIFRAGRTIPGPLVFYVKELLKSGGVRSRQAHPVLEDDFVKLASPSKPKYFRDLNRQLLDDIYRARLKIFLKCEDRCGMWHGVESRTPFADDHELMELMFSFNGEKKIQHGVSKYLLREAVKDRLPREIYSRYDKKGFETPMNSWLTEMRPLMLDEVKASRLPFVRYDRLDKKFPSNPANDRLLFRMFILSRWKAAFSA